MSDPATAEAAAPEAVIKDRHLEAAPEAMPKALSEIDRLKLALAKEKQARLQGEAANLQMLQRQVQAQMQASMTEGGAFSEYLKATYKLAPNDQLMEDGSIIRAPVRAVPDLPKPA